MKNVEQIFEDAMLHWRDNKGVGTAIIPHPLNDKAMVLGILQKVYNKSPTSDVIIITDTFQERIDIIEYITHQEDEDNNIEFKKLIESKTLKVFTISLILNGYDKIPSVCILYHVSSMCKSVEEFLSKSKFKLVVLNKLMKSTESMAMLYKVCPLLADFKQNEIDEIRISTPVEENQIGITIPYDSEDKKLLDYYTSYINTSIGIFGSFDLIKEAREGNVSLNISSAQICSRIASDNGWNEHLDMSIEYNVELDKLYNPANIRDRATMTYEIIRNRNQLLSDYKGKLEKILDIVKENEGAKILIINKRGEFASAVTDYINSMSENIICANYHDKVDLVPMIDDEGNPVYYKSGINKGIRRLMAAQAQKHCNQKLFNKNKINILSTGAAPDKDLCIEVDIIIITSSFCEEIKSYMYRLSKLHYRNNIIKVYSLYVKDSVEEMRLANKMNLDLNIIVNKCENEIVSENNSDFVIVD